MRDKKEKQSFSVCVYLNVYLSGRRKRDKVTVGKIILQNYFPVLPIIKFELLAFLKATQNENAGKYLITNTKVLRYKIVEGSG
jgi:hypothetical protein